MRLVPKLDETVHKIRMAVEDGPVLPEEMRPYGRKMTPSRQVTSIQAIKTDDRKWRFTTGLRKLKKDGTFYESGSDALSHEATIQRPELFDLIAEFLKVNEIDPMGVETKEESDALFAKSVLNYLNR